MVVAGIIAEYNPFHNGHLYQIRKIKEKLNPDYIIVVLGNNFSQRGEACILDKFEKTKIALSLGVDLVIEMPTIFSTSSAEYFAKAGCTLLNNTNVVTHLCFGAETDNLDKLINIAHLLANEPKEFKKLLKEELNKGLSFPIARSNALSTIFKNDAEIKEIISLPNNILAIEYIKELIKLKSKIKPYLIKRNGPGFYSNEAKDNISSATNIRNILSDCSIKDKEMISSDVSNFVPEVVTNIFANKQKNNYRFPLSINDYSDILLYKLKTLETNDLKNINEVREGIDNTLYEASKTNNQITDIISFCKSKRFTYTSISRIVTNIILNITKEDFKFALKNLNSYIRVLGFKASSEKLLSTIVLKNDKNKHKTKIITNLNKFIKDNNDKKNNKAISTLLLNEIKYNNIYHIKVDNKTNSDYTQKMIVL